ncbi:MAG TPA: hypothetical protein VLH35_08945 [Candidatus Acidoferrales bacterium]|nr:hypothetical protein [Candidatus Acidoferrales bacterium]
MDAFKKIIVISLALTLISLGFVAWVASDAIANGTIPDSESGVVTSKGPVTDGHPADFTVSLEGGKVLYIVNNGTLYNELAIGAKYVFACRIDILDDMIVIDSASLVVD